MVTEKYTMNGWSPKTWLRGNKESIKLVLTALGAYATWAVEYVQNPGLKVATVALSAAVIKLVLDSFDYWLKEE